MSAAVTTTNSVQSIAGSKRIALMRPRGTWLRTVTPCSTPDGDTSSTYRAAPVTLARPSLRSTERPMLGTSTPRLSPGRGHVFGAIEGTVGVVKEPQGRLPRVVGVHRDGPQHGRQAWRGWRIVGLPLVDLAIPIRVGLDAREVTAGCLVGPLVLDAVAAGGRADAGKLAVLVVFPAIDLAVLVAIELDAIDAGAVHV